MLIISYFSYNWARSINVESYQEHSTAYHKKSTGHCDTRPEFQFNSSACVSFVGGHSFLESKVFVMLLGCNLFQELANWSKKSQRQYERALDEMERNYDNVHQESWPVDRAFSLAHHFPVGNSSTVSHSLMLLVLSLLVKMWSETWRSADPFSLRPGPLFPTECAVKSRQCTPYGYAREMVQETLNLWFNTGVQSNGSLTYKLNNQKDIKQILWLIFSV